MRKKPLSKRTRDTSVGDEIVARLTDLAKTMERGEPIEPPRFTVRTIEIPDAPAGYDAAAVKATREKVGASQAIFAGLMGVSVKLVQAWESGYREPSPMARRLLDLVNEDARRWVMMGGSKAKAKA